MQHHRDHRDHRDLSHRRTPLSGLPARHRMNFATSRGSTAVMRPLIGLTLLSAKSAAAITPTIGVRCSVVRLPRRARISAASARSRTAITPMIGRPAANAAGDPVKLARAAAKQRGYAALASLASSPPAFWFDPRKIQKRKSKKSDRLPMRVSPRANLSLPPASPLPGLWRLPRVSFDGPSAVQDAAR